MSCRTPEALLAKMPARQLVWCSAASNWRQPGYDVAGGVRSRRHDLELVDIQAIASRRSVNVPRRSLNPDGQSAITRYARAILTFRKTNRGRWSARSARRLNVFGDASKFKGLSSAGAPVGIEYVRISFDLFVGPIGGGELPSRSRLCAVLRSHD